MTASPGTLIQPMARRDVLALAIADLEARAKFGRSVADAYGPAAVGRELRAGIELDAALAIILRTLQKRGVARLEDIVGVLRSAYASVPVIKEAAA